MESDRISKRPPKIGTSLVRKEELDAEIQNDYERIEQLRLLQQQQPSPAFEKLRTLKAGKALGETGL